MDFINTFNNREIALAIWLVIALIWVLSNNTTREAFLKAIKVFLSKGIVLPLIAMLIYISGIVVLLMNIGFWGISDAKNTALWVIGSALVTFINLNKVTKDNHYFKNAILDNFKLAILVEFIVNLYVFDLLIELVIFPALIFVAMLRSYIESNDAYKRLRKLLDFILVLFGLGLLVFSVGQIASNTGSFFSIENLKSFLLPPIFTISLLPFVYLTALYMQYELLFMRVSFANKNSNIASYAKWKIIEKCNFNLLRLNKLSKNIGYPKADSKESMLTLIKKALS